jgi:fucose permease
MGLTGGVWMARIPSAKAQVHLSDGTLGIALFAVPVGLVLGAALAERLVDRVGSAVLCRVSGVGSCAATVAPGLAHALPALLPALFAMGLFGGTLDVAQNAQGVRIEAAYGRRVMTSMHSCYSLGALIGSLAGSAFAWADVGLLPSLAAVGAIGAVIDGAAGSWLLPGTRRHGPRSPAPHEAGLPPAARTGVTEDSAEARKRVRRLVFALAVLAVCGLVVEGSAGDWSAVYLKDNLGASAGFAALGFSAFSVTMTLGRGVGDRLVHRFGVVPVIRACGLLATAGLALVLATPVPAVAIAGFIVFGSGLSIVIPQVFAAGGRADPFRPGSGLARVVGLGYTGMAAGPALIGLIADKIGLHLALFVPLALAAWIAVAAPALRAPRAVGHDRHPSPATQGSA